MRDIEVRQDDSLLDLERQRYRPSMSGPGGMFLRSCVGADRVSRRSAASHVARACTNTCGAGGLTRFSSASSASISPRISIVRSSRAHSQFVDRFVDRAGKPVGTRPTPSLTCRGGDCATGQSARPGRPRETADGWNVINTQRTMWLPHAGLTRAGFETSLLKMRHVKRALSAVTVKAESNDACGLAQLLRMGWFQQVHAKSIGSQEI
jgi:hypothetical protein